MALSPAVPVMAPGELITSSRANAVRSNLDRIDNRVTSELAAATTALQTRQAEAGPFAGLVAGSPTDATTGASFVTWLTIPIVGLSAPPTWATTVVITVHIGNVQAVTGDLVYAFDATFNGGSYLADRGAISLAAANATGSTSFVQSIPRAGLGGGSVLVGARRASGTGTLRATVSSKVAAVVSFR